MYILSSIPEGRKDGGSDHGGRGPGLLQGLRHVARNLHVLLSARAHSADHVVRNVLQRAAHLQRSSR